MKQKLLLTLFVAVLSLCSWANGTEIDGIYYLLDSDTKTASVTYTGKDYNTDNSYSGYVTIPNSVTLDDVTYYTVTSIGNYAFAYCTGLTGISIPSSVTRIGEYAFYGCSGLTYVDVLRTDPAEYNCDGSAFYDSSISTATLYLPSGSKDAYANTAPWSNFENIEEVPVQVGGLLYTILGDEATCVGRAESVDEWGGRRAEYNIPEHISLGETKYTVTAVDIDNYHGFIVLPKTLRRIVNLSGSNETIICLAPTPPDITSMRVVNCVLYVPDEYVEAHRKGWKYNEAFVWAKNGKEERVLPFYIRPMSQLLNFVFDSTTKTAKVSGFRVGSGTTSATSSSDDLVGCAKLRQSSDYYERVWAEQNDINLDWTIPATVQEILYSGNGANVNVRERETYEVKRVEKLLGAHSITLSEGIEEIGYMAFSPSYDYPFVTDAEGNPQYLNDPLERVTLPSSLKIIGAFAFRSCTSLRRIDFKEGLDSIGEGAFTYCISLEDCQLPASLRAMGYGHGNLLALQGFSIEPSNENCIVKDGVLFSDGGKTLLQYPAGKTDNTYEVPKGTQKLAKWSFEGVKHIENLILPTSVEEIGGYIFANTYCLKNIYCMSNTPPSVTGPLWLYNASNKHPDYTSLSTYEIYKTVTLHVPAGCKEIYASTAPWSNFYNIVDDQEPTAINLVRSDETEPDTYYTLQGQRIMQPQRGVNIIRHSDGTIRKILVN